MKFFLCLTFLATLTVTTVMGLAGQSACRDPSEVGKTFPHHWDPSKYWYCERLNENAVEKDCPKDTAYMHLLRDCIPWPNWVWKKPENPPTVPEGEYYQSEIEIIHEESEHPENESEHSEEPQSEIEKPQDVIEVIEQQDENVSSKD